MTRRRRKRSWISWVVILVLLIMAGVVCYLVWENYFKEDIREEESVVVDKENKEEAEVEIESEQEVAIKKDEVAQYDGENPNERLDLTGVVTYAGVSGENLMIRVNIDQYLSEGECMLLLSVAENIIYSNVARVVSSATTATCEGFNVPMGLLESGQYEILIKVESGGKKGEIKGEVRI